MTKQTVGRLAVLSAALMASLAVAELGARAFLLYLASPRQFERYASLAQLEARYGGPRLISDRHLGYVTSPDYRRGANRHNALGFRGDELARDKPEGTYRIVCVGGSTTYSEGVLDHHDAYPALLQRYLREHGNPALEVVNAGVPGYSSLESLINLETRVLDLSPDLVVYYGGINDVHPRLVWPASAYRGDQNGFLTRRAWLERPSRWEASTALRILLVNRGWATPQGSLGRILEAPPTSLAADFNQQWRRGTYPEGIFRTTSAEAILAQNKPIYFERNLRSIVSIAGSHGVGVVLVSFAFSPDFDGEAVASPLYQNALAEANAVLRSVASDTHALYFDLASELPSDLEYYTDGVHFTAAGNQLRARLVGDFLRANDLPNAK